MDSGKNLLHKINRRLFLLTHMKTRIKNIPALAVFLLWLLTLVIGSILAFRFEHMQGIVYFIFDSAFAFFLLVFKLFFKRAISKKISKIFFHHSISLTVVLITLMIIPSVLGSLILHEVSLSNLTTVSNLLSNLFGSITVISLIFKIRKNTNENELIKIIKSRMTFQILIEVVMPILFSVALLNALNFIQIDRHVYTNWLNAIPLFLNVFIGGISLVLLILPILSSTVATTKSVAALYPIRSFIWGYLFLLSSSLPSFSRKSESHTVIFYLNSISFLLLIWLLYFLLVYRVNKTTGLDDLIKADRPIIQTLLLTLMIFPAIVVVYYSTQKNTVLLTQLISGGIIMGTVIILFAILFIFLIRNMDGLNKISDK